MRFESIDLVRYGRFSGRQLHFPQQDSDFHLILGRNEAGKSTLRQAFRDLLFGIPMNTPMGFLHPGTELELAARLSGEPGELRFARRRKRKGGLVGPDGEPIAADALQGWLGDVTEAFYERMFGLDHHRLEAGSRAMLDAGRNGELYDIIQEGFRSKTLEEWIPILTELDIPFAICQTYEEVAKDEQAWANDVFYEMDYPRGPKALVRTPIDFEQTALPPYDKAPLLGENTEEVLSGLGYSEQEIQDMIADNTVGIWKE